jgi:uncharacterized protein (DUF433 family)
MMSDMNDVDLIRRITSDPAIFGGKPVVRGRRLAVEHVLSMLAAGDSAQDVLNRLPLSRSRRHPRLHPLRL